MSNSRNSKKYNNSKLVESSDESAPDSPAIKVKTRENTPANPDPLYYHPNAHPVLSGFFKRKSKELDDQLSSSAELSVSGEVSQPSVSGKKAGV